MTNVWLWRHPRPTGHEGRCIGRTDVPVDPRKARRLARRIQAHAQRRGLPTVVVTSPQRRAMAVGRWLRRLGWVHLVDDALREMDFGDWDGHRWATIPKTEVDAWVADFAHHAPGGGEPLAHLMRRAAAWAAPQAGVSVVGHAGWIVARCWIEQHGGGRWPAAAEWPMSPGYGAVCVTGPASLASSSP